MNCCCCASSAFFRLHLPSLAGGARCSLPCFLENLIKTMFPESLFHRLFPFSSPFSSPFCLFGTHGDAELSVGSVRRTARLCPHCGSRKGQHRAKSCNAPSTGRAHRKVRGGLRACLCHRRYSAWASCRHDSCAMSCHRVERPHWRCTTAPPTRCRRWHRPGRPSAPRCRQKW